jgi:hypothetical protein
VVRRQHTPCQQLAAGFRGSVALEDGSRSDASSQTDLAAARKHDKTLPSIR